jgi:hypothetical protein
MGEDLSAVLDAFVPFRLLFEGMMLTAWFQQSSNGDAYPRIRGCAASDATYAEISMNIGLLTGNDLWARDKEIFIRQSEIMEFKAGKAKLQALSAHTLFSPLVISDLWCLRPQNTAKLGGRMLKRPRRVVEKCRKL